MLKNPIGKNVLQAAQERIAWTFDNFESVYISFSAGKDSTVMLHLVAAEAQKRNRKIGLLMIDLEGQYKLTIDHALRCVDLYKDTIDLHWVCLPIHLRNAVSVYEPFWKCWDKDAKAAWIRDMPDCAVSDPDHYPFFFDGMEFEEFVTLFGEWYSKGEPTACFVGIRTDESLNRFRTIVQSKKETCQGHRFTSKVSPSVFNVYPIYDWQSADLWTYHAKNPDLPHNRLLQTRRHDGARLAASSSAGLSSGIPSP